MQWERGQSLKWGSKGVTDGQHWDGEKKDASQGWSRGPVKVDKD